MRLKVRGLEGAAAALTELPKATSKNVVKRAVIDAAQPMAETASDHAPVREGELSEGISVTSRIIASQASDSRRPGTYEVRAFVGPNYEPGTEGYAPHAHLVEFGTGPRQTKSGRSTGQMPAQPYMRPAFDSRKLDFISRFGAAIWEQIEKAAKRLARKKERLGK